MEPSQRALKMPVSPIRKLSDLADDARARGIKVYGLNIGQPDLPTPPEFFAAIEDFKDPVLQYGPSGGLSELRLVYRDYLAGYGIEVGIDDIWITIGGSEAILFALLGTCDPGDEVLVFEPFYTNYNGLAHIAGVKLVPITTEGSNGFHLPAQATIQDRISSRTRAIIICSPNNPTGTLYTEEELFILSKLARSHNLCLIADEVYREFVYDNRHHTSTLSLPGLEEQVVMADSISKRFSACGARIGFVVSRNRRLMQTILHFGQARLCPPTLEQVGAVAVFKTMHRYMKGWIEEYKRRRDLLYSGLRSIPGIEVELPEGAFYMMPRLPVADSEEFSRWLLTEFALDHQTVMLAPGPGFYASPDKGRNEVRVAYVLKEESLRNALRVLEAALKAYR